MTAADLERRLAAVLRERAEGAMNETNTQQRLQELLEAGAADVRRRRVVATGGLVAAALIALIVVLLAWPGSDDGQAPEPAGPTGPERIATDYLEAWAAYDEPAARALLVAESELVGWNGSMREWRLELRWHQAVGFELSLGTCQEQGSTPAGTTVSCAFDFHALGSDEMGLGPFSGSSYELTVQDDRVADAVQHLEVGTNGYSRTVWEPFGTWVAQERPQDFRVMYTPAGAMVMTDRSIPLWERNVRDYVAAQGAS